MVQLIEMDVSMDTCFVAIAVVLDDFDLTPTVHHFFFFDGIIKQTSFILSTQPLIFSLFVHSPAQPPQTYAVQTQAAIPIAGINTTINLSMLDISNVQCSHCDRLFIFRTQCW
jgi:hypothetical protein